jgi:hypothetical protein
MNTVVRYCEIVVMVRFLGFIVMVFVLVTSVSAQGVSPGQVLPASAVVSPMHIVFQQYNRCSAAALTMLLKHYGWEGTYDEVIAALNPSSSDVSVRSDEIAAYAQTFGLNTIARTGGTTELLRALVAANFPVMIENAYVDGPDWTVHNRIVMGYDADTIYAYDPILGWGVNGEGHAFPEAELDAAWREVNRAYIIVYPPGAELLLQTILGQQWEAPTSLMTTLEQAQAEAAVNPEDAFAWFNTGAALQQLGHSDEAAVAFDRAREIGLPWRIYWYRHELFEAYLAVGRYDDALALGQEVVANQPGVEEAYYYMGRAYAGLGQNENAAVQYQAALSRNPNYAAAASALSEIG